MPTDDEQMAEDAKHTAALIRLHNGQSGATVRAILSNNVNVILWALDRAHVAASARKVAWAHVYGTDMTAPMAVLCADLFALTVKEARNAR